jgi:hypothetical protein
MSLGHWIKALTLLVTEIRNNYLVSICDHLGQERLNNIKVFCLNYAASMLVISLMVYVC